MKLIIDIDNNVFTRLFDNGVDTSSEDRKVIDRAVRNGTPYEERPKGEWIEVKSDISKDIEYHIKCSNCGAFGLLNEDRHYYFSDYCPFCGIDKSEFEQALNLAIKALYADMRGDKV